MSASIITPGSRVVIRAVAFPENPDHAQYVGKTGVVTKFIKSRKLYLVQVDGLEPRTCLPENIQAQA